MAEQVPAVAVEKDAVRLDVVFGDTGAIGILVGEAHPPRNEKPLHEPVDGDLHVARAGELRLRVEDVGGRALDANDPLSLREKLARRLRQRGEQLRLGAVEFGAERRRLQPAHQRLRDKKRRRLAARQRHRRLDIVARQPVTALRAALSLHRYAECQQPVDIAIDGAHRHTESFRKLDRAALAAGEEQQDAERPFDGVHRPSPPLRDRSAATKKSRLAIGAKQS